MITPAPKTLCLRAALLLPGLFAALWLLTTTASIQAAPAPNDSHRLAFTPSGTNEFAFDTGVLRGTLRAKGRSMGLSSVTHVPSGILLDRSLGLFSHYRVLTTNHRFGTAAWDWPSTAALQSDGSVAVRWPAASERPFELKVVYQWVAANALDVETTVMAKAALPKFESFLASYFQTNFTNSLVYVQARPDQAGTPGFMAAEQKYGKWLVFPRDDAAAKLVQDGRWKYPPNPVDWIVMPRLGKPLAIRRDPVSGLTALLMAPPEDCFAVSTPYQTEGHGSVYLSLFGRDLKAGEIARARARLMILPKATDAEILESSANYLNTTGRK